MLMRAGSQPAMQPSKKLAGKSFATFSTWPAGASRPGRTIGDCITRWRCLIPGRLREACGGAVHLKSKSKAAGEGARPTSERFLFCAFYLCIWQRLALRHAEIFYVLENHGWHLGSLREFDVNEFSAAHILEHESGPHIGLHRPDFDILDFNPLHVTDVEAVRRHGAEAIGFRIAVFHFRRLNGGVRLGAAAAMQHQNIAQLDVFDIVTRNSSDKRGLPGSAVRDHNIADEHAP